MKEEDRKLWTERIKDYRFSGLTAAKWALDKGIAVHKLRYYINIFNNEKKQESNQESEKLQWASVVPKPPVVNLNNALKVTIGIATIEVVPGFDKETFELVVGILSQC